MLHHRDEPAHAEAALAALSALAGQDLVPAVSAARVVHAVHPGLGAVCQHIENRDRAEEWRSDVRGDEVPAPAADHVCDRDADIFWDSGVCLASVGE